MAIYIYRCDTVAVFEVQQKMGAEPLTECPTCGHPIHRVPQIQAVIYKSTGFTTTDKRFEERSDD